MKELLWWLLAGTRGGAIRLEILRILKERPYNAKQLSELLNLDYKTIRHHLRVLENNGIVVAEGGRYGTMYFLSPEMEQNYNLFLEICEKLGKSNIRR